MQTQNAILTAAFLFMLATVPVQAQTQQAAATSQKSTSAQNGEVRDLNNTVCPVSDQAIGSMGSAKTAIHKGYKVNLCCNGCLKKFNKNPDAFLQTAMKSAPASALQKGKKDAAVKPLNNGACPITGQPVGSMQAGSNIIYKGYQIGLCCDSCKAKFNENPDSYLKAILNAGQQPETATAQ